MSYKDRLEKINKITQEKIENNKLKALQTKLTLLENYCDCINHQLDIERRVNDNLEKTIKVHTVELTIIALCLVYLLLK